MGEKHPKSKATRRGMEERNRRKLQALTDRNHLEEVLREVKRRRTSEDTNSDRMGGYNH